MTIGQASV